MSDLIRPLVERVAGIQEDLRGLVTLKWAIVTQATPLRVRIAGEDDPIPYTPPTLVRGLQVGDRVMCAERGSRVTVLAVSGGGDTGNVTNAIVAETGWAITNQSLWRRNGLVVGNIQFERTGGTITVDVTGDITNQSVAVITDPNLRPVVASVVSGPRASGRLSGGEVQANGTWRLNAVAPGADITTGTLLSLGGTWIGAG